MWLSAWPAWALLAFTSLAVVRLLPEGYTRAAVATPILFMVPGSLTLGAAFGQLSRPRGVAFVGYAALLGAVWSAFASLLLYVRGVLISADSTYWCLLIVSAALAVVAEVRLLLGRPGKGRRARRLEILDQDGPDAEANDAEKPMTARGGGYAAAAVVAGASLLAGGLYAYDHLPHPAPAGYTWVDWTDSPTTGDIAIGSTGAELPFQIVHHQSDTTIFKLSAAWLGSRSTPLAKPVVLSIGPNRTVRGALFVPPLPNGCTYRIDLALTAASQIDPLTKKPQTWSINADVHDPNKSLKTCK
jgi:hypothetical protein